ncbi:MAG: hypothetical protein GEU73_03000 [Chloroflexi bacterium]|nr:hypothetical protein [Chloroflexota bacterium]
MATVRRTASAGRSRPVSPWQLPAPWIRPERFARTIREDAPGYVAALAFLAAYALLVVDAAPILQAALNLTGSGLAACYLWRKRALPNVILNVA